MTAPDLTLDDLAARLTAAYGTGGVKISAEIAPEAADLLAAVGLTEIVVQSSVPTPANGQLLLAGPTSAFADGGSASFTFTIDDGVLTVGLDAELLGQSLEFQALPWAQVDQLRLVIDAVGPADPITMIHGYFTGEIRLQGVKDPIKLTLTPSFNGGWTLEAADIPLPNPVELIETLLLQPPGSQILPPADTASHTDIKIDRLACDISQEFAVRSLEVSLGLGTWTIADHLPALQDVVVTGRLDFPDGDADDEQTDDTSPEVTILASATIDFPDGPKLPVAVRRTASEWEIGILGASDFGSIRTLIDKMMGEGTSATLPEAVTTFELGSVSLDLIVGQDGSLQSISVFASLGQKWTLVEGLDLDRLIVEVRHTPDSNTGYLLATIDIEEVAIPLSISKPSATDPVTISLGTADPPSISGMQALATVAPSGSSPSGHVPDTFASQPVSLHELTLTLDPEKFEPQQLTVDVRSDGPWSLPELPGFGVADIVVNLGIPFDEKSEVSAHISFAVHLGDPQTGPRLDFKVEKSSEASIFTFTGSLTNPPISLATVLSAFETTTTVPATLADVIVTQAEFSFTTGGDVTVNCSGTLPIGTEKVDTALTMTASKKNNTYSVEFSGTVTIDGQEFALALSADPSESRLIADYSGGTDLSVYGLLSQASPTLARGLFPDPAHDDLTVHLKDAIFALGAAAGQTPCAVFALDLEQLQLSNLPLVGGIISDAGADLQGLRIIAATSTPAAPAPEGSPTPRDSGDIAAWNALLGSKFQALPDTIGAGVVVSAVLSVASQSVPLALPAVSSPPTSAPGSGSPGTGAPSSARPDDGTKWFPVERTLGPVNLSRVGARFDSGVLWFVLDASMAFGGVSFELMGLALGSPVSSFAPQFNLQGLSLSFVENPISIAGAFLQIPDSAAGHRYDGAAVIHAESLTLGAVGSYSSLHGTPSLFVFAELDAQLGGPPALYITGLRAGFGYNRALRLPDQDEVTAFPLLGDLLPSASGNGSPGASSKTDGMLNMLKVLEEGEPGKSQAWLQESIGNSWLAAGVTFTSFEVVQTHALLIAEFGQQLQFALLGLSTMKLPQEGPETVAYVELGIEALLKPNDGFFGITARLGPNSYIIDPACRLTGGFAFYVWFGHEHPGDFVITLGGYRQSYQKPEHYPDEPRLALHWPVSDLVTIDADAYFALTPSSVMAGGRLQVLFQEGNLRAWLIVHADFFMEWRPLHYEVNAAVSVGVSYRMDWGLIHRTFSLELGADLSLWGPPTGGKAHVSWWVISFTVGFGGEPVSPSPEDRTWAKCVQPLLPKNPCTVSLRSGLLGQQDMGETTQQSAWVVRADDLEIVTESAIPASQVFAGGTPQLDVSEGIAVRPLGLASVASEHRVTMTGPNGTVDLVQANWKIERNRRNLPTAMWAKSDVTEELIRDQVVGLTLTAPQPTAGNKTPAISPDSSPAAQGELPQTSPLPAPGVVMPDKSTMDRMLQADYGTAREALHKALEDAGISPGPFDLVHGPSFGDGPLPDTLLAAKL